MQQNNYIEAEDAYRRALVIAPDNNKMCNLGICLMKQGRLGEAKETLRLVKPAVVDGPRGVDSHLKAYERAQQMLRDLESEMMNSGGDRVEQRKLFDAFLGSSALWQPQPCKEHVSSSLPISNQTKTKDTFADENKKPVGIANNNNNNNPLSLNIDAKPFYVKGGENAAEGLKRTRSVNEVAELEGGKARRRSGSPEKNDWSGLLPDSKDFEEAIIAAVLGSTTEPEKMKTDIGKVVGRKIEKRLKVFQDITPSLSPRA